MITTDAGPDQDVVVTGLGIVCSAGRDTAEFWRSIDLGQHAIRPVTDPLFSSFTNPIAGVVPNEWYDEKLSVPTRATIDPDARMAVVAAIEAVDHAGLKGSALVPARSGLVLGKCQGVSAGGHLEQKWIHSTADAIARHFDLQGPRITIATACAAGGNAVGAARDRLRAGDADVMLAGGVDLLQRPTYAGFNALQSLDSQPCSPYSRSGGLNLGEGAAFLILELREHAQTRGATILAEVRGYGLSADAYHATAPDPTGRGAFLAVQRALADAAVAVSDVTYVNGHGTGTPANDSTERRLMRNLFGGSERAVPITSTKSFIGHTLGASGAIEALTSVLSIQHQKIPPTVNVADDASIDFDCVPNNARAAEVQVVVSNNYAFGGNNVSLILSADRGSRRTSTRVESPREVVITGVGMVGRLGIAPSEWLSAVKTHHGREQANGRDLERELKTLLQKRPFAPSGTWRHMSHFTRCCLAATRLALDDASLQLTREQRETTGLILGTTSGPAKVAVQFERSSYQDDAAPGIHEFAQVTLNAPAGSICQALGFRGPTTTITSGAISGTLGLETACDLIASGVSDVVVVVAADEACDATLELYNSFGWRNDSVDQATAAVGIVVESAESAAARCRVPYARIAGVAHTSDTFDVYRHRPSGARYSDAISTALSRSGVRAEELDLIALAAGGSDLDVVERSVVDRLNAEKATEIFAKLATGECEAASGLANVALASLMLAEEVQQRAALATAAAFGGAYAGVVLTAGAA